MSVTYPVDSFVPDNLDYAPLTSPVVMGKERKAMVEAQGSILIIDAIVIAVFIFTQNKEDAFIFLIAIILALHIWLTYSAWKDAVLKQFAELNGLSFLSSQSISYPAMMFKIGHDRNFSSGFMHKKHEWLVGNYQYSEGSGKSERTMTYGVCVIPLSQPLPNILIDAKLNFGLGFRNIILPFSPSKDQKIQLEGDFNKYFDVYMPKEYETDLLYILTPELMAYLIDYGKGYNFEICEDKLFIYSHFFKTNPPSVKKTLQDILPIARFFQYQFVDNTYKYRDEKVLLTDGESTTVASTGRRLKKSKMSSFVAGAAIIGAVSVVFFIMLVTADY